jgi:hypothetical protein
MVRDRSGFILARLALGDMTARDTMTPKDHLILSPPPAGGWKYLHA